MEFDFSRYSKIVANDLSLNGSISSALGGLSQWSSTGSEIYFNDGNVGIGTTSPASLLDVNGGMRAGYNSDTTSYFGTTAIGYCGHSNLMGIAHIDRGSANNYALIQNSAGQTYMNSSSGQSLHFRINNSDKMIINSSGNVGIGTTSPEQKLHVNGNQYVTGNVGIGSPLVQVYNGAHPAYPLDVNGTVNASAGRFMSSTAEAADSGFSWGQSYTQHGQHSISFHRNISTTTTGGGGSNNPNSKPNVLPYIHFKGTSYNRRSYWGQQKPEWELGMFDNHWARFSVNCYEFYGNTIYDQEVGYFSALNGQHGYFDFTGQHRSFIEDLHVNDNDGEKYKGLIVCANKDSYTFITDTPIKGKDAITINESLPDVSLSKKYKDKSVYGVISSGEEDNGKGTRKYEVGNFVSTYPHQHGDFRFHINALGEGAIWVCNKHGNLESGDYITSSSIPGYGVLQDDDILHNYTVAKITMSCDFQPKIQYKKQIIKQNIEFTIDASNNCYDMSGNIIYKPRDSDTGEKTYKLNKYEYTHDTNARVSKVTENILNEHGEIQWEDTTEQEYAYEIRHLDPSGNIITKEQHDTTISNGGSAYIAAFVGCTYHCG